MENLTFFIVGAIAVLLVGISKGGFGEGFSLLATPLLMLTVPGREAIGIMLPLLIGCDIVAVYFYRKDWSRPNIAALIPGFAAGVIIASFFIGSIPDDILKRAVGALALSFLILKIILKLLRYEQRQYSPRYYHGTLAGAAAGFTSTLAHAAGPIVTMYLLPQKLGKKLFVGTFAIYFFVGNLLKVPPYIYLGILNRHIFLRTLIFAPLIPIGVLVGIWMNKHIHDKFFNWMINAFLAFAGIQLLAGITIIDLFKKL